MGPILVHVCPCMSMSHLPMVVLVQIQVSPWLKGWGIYDDFQSWICGINLSQQILHHIRCVN